MMTPLAGTLLALVVGWSGRVVAGDLHAVTGFDEYAEDHGDIANALGRRPSLARDPGYLLHHPSLARFLHDNPLARAELEDEDDDVPLEIHREDERRERERAAARRHVSPDPSRRLDDADPDD